MNIDSKTIVLGLLGNPSRHSLSPLIQNHFLKSYGINGVYLTFEPEIKSLKQAFEGAQELGFKGLNITMPFKEDIFNLVSKTEGTAQVIKAINTVKFHKNKDTSAGFSTDGDGVIKSLEDKGFEWEGKNCLIIGAGGAAKSAVYAIFKKPVNKIYIFDIYADKPVALAKTISTNIRNFYSENHKIENNNRDIKTNVSENMAGTIDKKIEILHDLTEMEKTYDSLDLIINCSPAGMDTGNPVTLTLLPLPEYWNLKNKFVFDMVYKPLNTLFIKKAKKDGAAAIIPGIDMLVNQAVYSFNIWFEIMPEEKIIGEVKEMIKKINI